MSSVIEPGGGSSAPAGGAADSLVPVVRRVLQTGLGPPALVSYIRACGIARAPGVSWTQADERAVRDLARRVAGGLAPARPARHDAETVVGTAAGPGW